MTQNTSYSGSMADDKHDDPNEIRSEIDQTRAAVGDKIDQLQARLDPSRLKQQATETVHDILNDTASSVTEYVRTHRDEMVSSVADAARRNPLPTALLGLGLGWLILESVAGSKRHDDDRSENERRDNPSRGRSRGYEGSSGRVSGEFVDEPYFNEEYDRYRPAMGGKADYQGSHEFGNGKQHGSNPVAKAAGAVKDTVGDVSQDIKERASDMGHEIKERASDVGQEIKERVSDVTDRVGGTVDSARRQADEWSDQAQHGMQRAGYRMSAMQQRARYEGQRRGRQVVRNLEDNPLIYGAVALAAGAALALFLPSTRVESRAFGEARDQIMDKGKEVFETAKSRAQDVVSEIRPELEEKARQLVSDVKEAGKEVVQGAAEELRPVVDKAIAKTKEEAKNVAQEAGLDPNKLTGNSAQDNKPSNDKVVVNRDTLRGQWTQLKGEVKSKWGQLTDDELTRVEGDMEKLLGSLQTRYGYSRARAEQEVNDFFNSRKA